VRPRSSAPPADALVDTGSAYCLIPEFIAQQLGLQPGERLGAERVQGVLGHSATMDRHRLEYVRAGSAQAYGVNILVGEAVLGLLLLGMSFIGKFNTTLDLDEDRVVFRPRIADRERTPY
jgi:predicted aspartyl protease